MAKKSQKSIKKVSGKDFLFTEVKQEIKAGEALEGLVIRPAVLMVSFISFIFAMFFILLQNLKWGGSLIIFAFVLNIYSIYQSLSDNPSIFRTLNVIFKIVMFIAEIIVFNYILILL